jgi:hypothetical protein
VRRCLAKDAGRPVRDRRPMSVPRLIRSRRTRSRPSLARLLRRPVVRSPRCS